MLIVKDKHSLQYIFPHDASPCHRLTVGNGCHLVSIAGTKIFLVPILSCLTESIKIKPLYPHFHQLRCLTGHGGFVSFVAIGTKKKQAVRFFRLISYLLSRNGEFFMRKRARSHTNHGIYSYSKSHNLCENSHKKTSKPIAICLLIFENSTIHLIV